MVNETIDDTKIFPSYFSFQRHCEGRWNCRPEFMTVTIFDFLTVIFLSFTLVENNILLLRKLSLCLFPLFLDTKK